MNTQDLILDTSILKSADGAKAYGFLAGIEKSLIENYRQVFQNAQWKELRFLEESLALAKSVPVRFKQVPALMFVHFEVDTVLVSSIFHERLFSSFQSKDISKDLLLLHEAFYEQVKALPTHIIVSGDPSQIEKLNALKFTQSKPVFAPANTHTATLNTIDETEKFLIATGVALSFAACPKDSLRLVELIK